MGWPENHKKNVESIPHSKSCDEENKRNPGCGESSCPRCIAGSLLYDYNNLLKKKGTVDESKVHIVDNHKLLERFVKAHEDIAKELGNINSGLDLLTKAVETLDPSPGAKEIADSLLSAKPAGG